MPLEPILTFNGLFVEAKQRGFRMSCLCEDDKGFWFCTWRKNGVAFEFGQPRRQPFTAAHDAFMAALEGADMAAPVGTDLFG